MRKKATIYFEDHGQDFLEWDVKVSGLYEATVTECRPFQDAHWSGVTILFDKKMKAGDLVTYTRNFVDAYNIKYPIEKVVIHADENI